MRKVASKRQHRKASGQKITSKAKSAGNISSRISVWVICVCVVLFLAILVIINHLPQEQQIKTHAAGANPLLYGTNLTLNDASDQFLTSAQTRTDMQQMHITTIRMPIRSVGAPGQAEIQAAQDIKALGAVPLVILKYSQPDPAGAGVQVVQAMNKIFGTSTVYYEFGNERDLNGVDQVAYTNAWNQYIPTIKAAAPNGKFGGPTNYQTNPSYIAYFVQHANPAPDFISWHEYTCGNNDSAQTCISNISHWATHISSTRTAIAATGKSVPPIFITEWNYDATPPSGDSRITPQFQQQFVTTALQELTKDGVTAAYQFVVTGNGPYQMVDPSGALTAAGQAFQQAASGNTNNTNGNTTSSIPSSSATSATPAFVSPTFACVGTGICTTSAPRPLITGSVPLPTNTNALSMPPGSISGSVIPSLSPSQSMLQPISGTPNGTSKQQLLQLINELLKEIDVLEKKVSQRVHKLLDGIENQLNALKHSLLGGGSSNKNTNGKNKGGSKDNDDTHSGGSKKDTDHGK